jgi:hypothetical protein
MIKQNKLATTRNMANGSGFLNSGLYGLQQFFISG